MGVDFEEWKKQRNEVALKRDYSGAPVIEEYIDETSDEQLDFTLDGREYLSWIKRVVISQ